MHVLYHKMLMRKFSTLALEIVDKTEKTKFFYTKVSCFQVVFWS